MVEPGFTKGQSDNLPYVDEFMVAIFIKNNECYTSVEIRGVKSSRAAREEYGDNAIGYVQVKREAGKCVVKGKITPEHNVHKKSYAVEIKIDEGNSSIDDVTCADCAAAEGGCKHCIAFVMWVHRRCRDPAPTETECYWKKSTLSKVGTSLKFIMAAKLNLALPKESDAPGTSATSAVNVEVPSTSERSNFSDKFLKEAKKRNLECEILRHVCDTELSSADLSMHRFMHNYTGRQDSEEFLSYIKNNVTSTMLDQAAHDTETQYKSPLWFELRYGRITVSKAYEVANCKTASGTLVEQVMGAIKTPDTYAMKRGRLLEAAVRTTLEDRMKITFQESGFLICEEYPFIGASPDGVSDEYCLEIKCPLTARTVKNYLKDNTLSKKFYAQVQLQMFVAKKRNVYFVSHTKTSESENVTCMEVDFDEEYVENLLNMLSYFWKNYIFQHIYKNIKNI